MAEGVGEDDVAALLSKVNSGIVSLLGLGDVPLEDDLALIDAQGGQSGAQAGDVVGGVAFVLIADADETDLDLVSRHAFGAGERDHTEEHAQGKQQAGNLLHDVLPPTFTVV